MTDCHEDSGPPAPFNIDAHVRPIMDRADIIRRDVLELLIKHGLPQLYAECVASDVTDGWANDDPAPIWMWSGYTPPDDLPERDAWELKHKRESKR